MLRKNPAHRPPKASNDEKPGKKFAPTYLGAWRKLTRNPYATQADLSEAMDISIGHLSNIERGKRQYTQELLESAVAYLRRWFPTLTVAHILTVNPNDPGAIEVTDPVAAELVDRARRIPPQLRDAARKMLSALAEEDPGPWPARPSRGPSRGRQRGPGGGR